MNIPRLILGITLAVYGVILLGLIAFSNDTKLAGILFLVAGIAYVIISFNKTG